MDEDEFAVDPAAVLPEDCVTEKDEVLALAALDEANELVGLADINGSARPPVLDDYDDYDDPLFEAVPPPVNYPSWTAENSFVVSGPLGKSNFPGRRFETREQAEAWMVSKYGFIYERIHIPGRWAGRVPKPRAQ